MTVVIPNYNGKEYLGECLSSLQSQDCPVLVVDNGSGDGSRELVREQYPWAELLCLDKNYGFCRAVNEGIRAARTEYVLLLNNDVRAEGHLVEYLWQAIQQDEDLFSCQAQMRRMDRPELLDNAGDFYCALGWALTRGRDKKWEDYQSGTAIFSACAGAAIYRKSALQRTGLFDEAHFAYLEDVDIGYRARILGYRSLYVPQAVVWHKGSASSGSRHNRFKVKSAARNNLYLIYKNMPLWQILINLPLLLAGTAGKLLFFTCKGMGLSYLDGLRQGILLARKGEKTPFLAENFDNCWRIQLELWRNLRYIIKS